jgi:transcriptional regulator with XRE-family HTH domain
VTGRIYKLTGRIEPLGFNPLESLGEILKKRRLQLGLRQADIARALLETERQVGRLENEGSGERAAVRLLKLMRLYGLERDDLLDRMGVVTLAPIPPERGTAADAVTGLDSPREPSPEPPPENPGHTPPPARPAPGQEHRPSE